MGMPKGHKLSPEKLAARRAKMAGRVSPLRGRKKTEAHRKALSEACKGRPSQFKGKMHTEETRRKLREAWVQRKLVNPPREKPPKKCRKGEIRSEETRRRMREGWARRDYKSPLSSEELQRRSERMSGSGNPFYGRTHTTEARDKIRAANTGRRGYRHPEDALTRVNRGPKHYRWRGGSYTYGPDWTIHLRNEIRDRDDHCCQLCGRPAKDVHHIIPFRDCRTLAMFPHERRNLICLCRKCHRRSEDNLELSIYHFFDVLSFVYGYSYDDYYPLVRLLLSHTEKSSL